MESSRAFTRACTSLKLIVATAALALGLSGVALAGTTTSTPTTVTYTGDPGEQNAVVAGYDPFSPGGPYIVVQDQNPTFANNNAGPGCTATNPNSSSHDSGTVWCGAGGITALDLNGGDQNDTVSIGTITGSISGPEFAQGTFPPGLVFTLNGGDGNDTINLPVGTTVSGTAPTATGNGDAGNDTINIVDNEVANGGAGDDNITNNGLFFGEKPPFVSAIMNGGADADALNGFGGQNSSPTPDVLNGDDGDDGLFPGGGPENLSGGAGNDLVNWNGFAAPVNVSLDNAANDGVTNQGANAHSDIETLLGSGGAPDVLSGAPGVPNFVDGFGGNDTFNVASNPADPDIVVCGDGFVTINADALDTFDTVGPTGCRGRLNKPPVASGLTLKIRSSSTKIDSDGQVAIKVGCRGTGNCRGVLSVDKNGTVIGTTQFVVPNGGTKRVSFLPRSAYAKRLKSGNSVKVTATADASDAGGATGSATGTVTIKGKKKHKK